MFCPQKCPLKKDDIGPLLHALAIVCARYDVNEWSSLALEAPNKGGPQFVDVGEVWAKIMKKDFNRNMFRNRRGVHGLFLQKLYSAEMLSQALCAFLVKLYCKSLDACNEIL